MNARVFIPRGLSAVIGMHAEMLRDYPRSMTVLDVLERQVATLYRAHGAGEEASCIQISNWLPGFAGRSDAEILAGTLSEDDTRLAVAREHGFADWGEATDAGDVRFDAEFESAVNAVVGGRLPALERLIFNRPGIVVERSVYGHRATLLHYVAANGVETWRQTVPRIAPRIVRLLIDAGANATARAYFYGGEYETGALVASSAHPAAAGLTDAILAELARC